MIVIFYNKQPNQKIYMKFKNKLFMLLMLLISFFLFSCNNENAYDKGYENAWEEEDEPSRWASKEAKQGYEDGLMDSDSYHEGYDDALDYKKPEFTDDDLYMEGYSDGKEER